MAATRQTAAETIEDAFDHVIDKLIELGGDNNAEN